VLARMIFGMTVLELELLIEGRAATSSGRGQQLRKAAGLSCADVARLVGVTQPAISRSEAGERMPNARCAVAYARVLRQLARLVADVTTPNSSEAARTGGSATTTPVSAGCRES
jgi:DNA-binding XRE family transcriptional regulator